MNFRYLEVGDFVFVMDNAGNKRPAEIQGFGTYFVGRTNNNGLTPGTYWDKRQVTVLFIQSQEISILPFRDVPLDEILIESRIDRLECDEHKYGVNRTRENRDRVGPLPKTAFWEGDIVQLVQPVVISDKLTFDRVFVEKIDYSRIGDVCDDGTPYPIYRVSNSFMKEGASILVAEKDLKLIKRGAVWKFYHDQGVQFASLKKGIRFFRIFGQYDEAYNPYRTDYQWNFLDAQKALKQGRIHWFEYEPSFGTKNDGGPVYRAYTFKDEALAAMARNYLLAKHP